MDNIKTITCAACDLLMPVDGTTRYFCLEGNRFIINGRDLKYLDRTIPEQLAFINRPRKCPVFQER